jgi:hypothetical protein
MTRYPLYRRTGGDQGRGGQVRRIWPPPPGFDPRTVQPAASRYTDWAIPAHYIYEGSNSLRCSARLDTAPRWDGGLQSVIRCLYQQKLARSEKGHKRTISLRLIRPAGGASCHAAVEVTTKHKNVTPNTTTAGDSPVVRPDLSNPIHQM